MRLIMFVAPPSLGHDETTAHKPGSSGSGTRLPILGGSSLPREEDAFRDQGMGRKVLVIIRGIISHHTVVWKRAIGKLHARDPILAIWPSHVLGWQLPVGKVPRDSSKHCK